MSTELRRVAELADRVADRTLIAFEQGALTAEEFRANPDVALVIDAARLLHAAGAEFPAGVVRLAQKAAEQTRSFSAAKKKTAEAVRLVLNAGRTKPFGCKL